MNLPSCVGSARNQCCFCGVGLAEDGTERSVARCCVRRGYECSLLVAARWSPSSLKFVCPPFDFLSSFAGVSNPKLTRTWFYCLVYRRAKPHTQAPIRFLQNTNPSLNSCFFPAARSLCWIQQELPTSNPIKNLQCSQSGAGFPSTGGAALAAAGPPCPARPWLLGSRRRGLDAVVEPFKASPGLAGASALAGVAAHVPECW